MLVLPRALENERGSWRFGRCAGPFRQTSVGGSGSPGPSSFQRKSPEFLRRCGIRSTGLLQPLGVLEAESEKPREKIPPGEARAAGSPEIRPARDLLQAKGRSAGPATPGRGLALHGEREHLRVASELGATRG